MSPFLAALLQDVLFIAAFIGIGVYLAKKRNRSVYWGLIGPTLIGLIIILLLPKKADADSETTTATSAG